ncbi:MAG: hypothetical protein AMJ43_04420 [Coxiella sp. DG_40]|nr:MAG: hypothetical protein AMJ43_04420 [Coxiella sp. DG_40]
MTFKKGRSGNPQGRPRGVKDRRVLFAEMLDNHKDTLFNKALELALAGNEQMLKLLLDRILPAKPRDNPLPEIEGLDGNIVKQCNKVMSLIAMGTITPDEGNSLLFALTTKMRLVELNDLFDKLEELKKMIKRNS